MTNAQTSRINLSQKLMKAKRKTLRSQRTAGGDTRASGIDHKNGNTARLTSAINGPAALTKDSDLQHIFASTRSIRHRKPFCNCNYSNSEKITNVTVSKHVATFLRFFFGRLFGDPKGPPDTLKKMSATTDQKSTVCLSSPSPWTSRCEFRKIREHALKHEC